MPRERFREAVLMALPDDEVRGKLKPLPDRGEFDELADARERALLLLKIGPRRLEGLNCKRVEVTQIGREAASL